MTVVQELIEYIKTHTNLNDPLRNDIEADIQIWLNKEKKQIVDAAKIALLQQLEGLSDHLPCEVYTKKVIEVKSNVVGQSEQLVCDRCKEQDKEEPTDPYCMECKIEIEQQAD